MAHPMNQSALIAELIDRTREAGQPNDVAAALHSITATVVDLDVADWAGITERTDRGRFQTLAATDGVVSEVDDLQYRFGEGPCVDATYEDGVLVAGDIRVDQRWPRWGPGALERGVRSVMSVNLHASESAMGALNLYRSAPRDFTEDELEFARILGAHASIVLAHHRSDAHLWKAVDARHRIGQAQGILMERFSIDADRSFALLVRLSQTQNTKLHLIADQLIVTGKLPESTADSPPAPSADVTGAVVRSGRRRAPDPDPAP